MGGMLVRAGVACVMVLPSVAVVLERGGSTVGYCVAQHRRGQCPLDGDNQREQQHEQESKLSHCARLP
jgi:hypothetical protein